MIRKLAPLVVIVAAAGCGQSAPGAPEPIALKPPSRAALDDVLAPPVGRHGPPQELGRSQQTGEEAAMRREPAPLEDPEVVAAARRTVEQMLDGVNRRDPSICARVFTARRLRDITGLTGRPALEKCRSDVRRLRGRVDLVEFEGVRRRYGWIVVRFTTESAGRLTSQTLGLRSSGGRLKVDGQLQ